MSSPTLYRHLKTLIECYFELAMDEVRHRQYIERVKERKSSIEGFINVADNMNIRKIFDVDFVKRLMNAYIDSDDSNLIFDNINATKLKNYVQDKFPQSPVGNINVIGVMSTPHNQRTENENNLMSQITIDHLKGIAYEEFDEYPDEVQSKVIDLVTKLKASSVAKGQKKRGRHVRESLTFLQLANKHQRIQQPEIGQNE